MGGHEERKDIRGRKHAGGWLGGWVATSIYTVWVWGPHRQSWAWRLN